jgi:hypothetical protein
MEEHEDAGPKREEISILLALIARRIITLLSADISPPMAVDISIHSGLIP